MITIPFIKLPRFIAAGKMNRDSKHVHSINNTSAVKVKEAGGKRGEDDKNQSAGDHNQKNNEEVSKHVGELKETVKSVNLFLAEKNASYRFNIRMMFDEYFIEMIFLDEFDNVIESKKRNVTHEEFSRLLEHIETGEGVFFEDTV